MTPEEKALIGRELAELSRKLLDRYEERHQERQQALVLGYELPFRFIPLQIPPLAPAAVFVFTQDPNQAGNVTEEEKQALRSSAKRISFVDVLASTVNQAPREAGTVAAFLAAGPQPHVPTGTPVELAPLRVFPDDIPQEILVRYHVARTKSVSVVMLKSGRYGVARVRFATDPPTRNAQGEPPSPGGTSNLSSGYVHVGAPHATRAEAEKAAYALAHKLGLIDGWL